MLRRTLWLTAAAAAFSGCASAPVEDAKPVAVKTGALSRDYSSFDTTVRHEAGAMNHSFTASLDPEADDPLTRLQSAYTHQLGDEETLRVGDTVSSIGMWGTTLRFGGVQYGTRSGPREDVITDDELATPGLAVLPTTADALLSLTGADSVVARTDLEIERSWRSGELSVSDAYGRSTTIDAPVIASTRLVAEGCSDFSVGAGKVRRDYAIESHEYGPAFANATVACGAPLGFTVEGHGEYLDEEVAALGVGLARRIGPLGTASFAYASSRAQTGEAGWLTRVGFEHENDWFSLAWRRRLQSPEFREAGGVVLTDPIMERDLASVGVNVAKRANLSLAYATQTTWSRERTNLIAIQQSLNIGRGALSMSAGHSLEDNFGTSLFLSYKRPLGGAKRRERSQIQEFDPVVLESAGAHSAVD